MAIDLSEALQVQAVSAPDRAGAPDADMPDELSIALSAEAPGAALQRLTRLAQVLSAAGQILVQAGDEDDLLQRFCELLTRAGGYPLAYVCLPVDAAALQVRVAAAAGPCRDYARLWTDADRGRGPSGMAIRNGAPVIARDIARDPGYGMWRIEATRRGLVSSSALPLVHERRVYGSLRIFSRDAGAFTEDELALLGQLADDLAYGLLARRAERARRDAEQRVRLLERAIDASSYGVLVIDVGSADLPVVYASEGFSRLTGHDGMRVPGRSATFFFGHDPDAAELDAFTLAISDRRQTCLQVRTPRADGTLFWNEIQLAPVSEGRRVTHMVCTMHDVSERKHYQEHLAHLATHDCLTGLANRVLFHDRLQRNLLHQERIGRAAAVLLIDLDRYKEVNASLGHAVAERVLIEVAGRLQRALRDEDTVARLGVDQFAVMLPDIACEEDVVAVSEKIRAALALPLQVCEPALFLSASIGVSTFPRDGNNAELLLASADAAMYRAKEEGGNAVSFFACEQTRRAEARLSMEAELRRALERGEFELHYQPKRELASGQLVGAEALVRWRRADGRMVPPGEFIPVAERSGLILPIGRLVLETAIAQQAAWGAAECALVPVAVNLSSRQLRESGLARSVGDALAQAGVSAEWLELEITESMVMSNPEQACEILGQLKEMGVTLALDDFGTGYSSLGYLKRFPLDHLKIDRSFVRDVTVDPDDAAIIQAIIAMARSLRMKVIAEGVETCEQESFLRDSGCDMMQGYLYSRPLPAVQFSELIRGTGHHAAPRAAVQRI